MWLQEEVSAAFTYAAILPGSVFGLFLVTGFCTQINVFKVNLPHKMYQYFIHFYGQIVFCCMHLYHILFIPFSAHSHLGCVYILAMNVTKNIYVQDFVWSCFQFSWVYMRGIAESNGNSIFNIFKNCQTVSKVATPFYISISSK